MYEVLAICWEAGQASSIHNHQGQNCWMAVPMGRLMIQNYSVLGCESKALHCNLVKADTIVMDRGNPVAVNRETPVHRVLNLAEFESRAVSIHVYSLPFDRCRIYSEGLNSYRDMGLSYTSEYGKRI
jgi:cysteine dioxygenase